MHSDFVRARQKSQSDDHLKISLYFKYVATISSATRMLSKEETLLRVSRHADDGFLCSEAVLLALSEYQVVSNELIIYSDLLIKLFLMSLSTFSSEHL